MTSNTKLLFISWIMVFLSIPTLSILGRKLQYWVADSIGYGAAAWIISLLLLSCISVYLLWLLKNGKSLPWLHLTWFLPLFLIIPLLLDRVEERLHFLTFGVFGALTMLLVKPRQALLICVLVSITDEILQFYLPDRVGDWHDVVMNTVASVAAALFILVSIRPQNLLNKS